MNTWQIGADSESDWDDRTSFASPKQSGAARSANNFKSKANNDVSSEHVDQDVADASLASRMLVPHIRHQPVNLNVRVPASKCSSNSDSILNKQVKSSGFSSPVVAGLRASAVRPSIRMSARMMTEVRESIRKPQKHEVDLAVTRVMLSSTTAGYSAQRKIRFISLRMNRYQVTLRRDKHT